MNLTIAELKKLFPENTLEVSGETALQGVSQDTRKIRPGELYVAVKGENFDGHDFVAKAFDQGAVAAIVSRTFPRMPGCCYVEDTVAAFGTMAAYYRKKFTRPVIAITGSSGKTTNKEIITHVLGSFGGVVATEGNLNNHLGVPLTISRFTDTAQYFVVEMGMNHTGEIRYLAKMAKPDIGLITNVGHAHLEGVGGTLEGVARAKGELFEELDPHATAIVNLDDPLVAGLPTRARKLTFGFAPDAEIRAADPEYSTTHSRFNLHFGKRKLAVTLKASGTHHVRNALAAFAVGHVLGLDAERMVSALESFRISLNRGRVIEKNGQFFVDDTYNANPDSMQAAFESFCLQFKGYHKIGVLGGMLELGPDAASLHGETGKAARQAGLDEILVYGSHSEEYLRGFGYGAVESQERCFSDHVALANALQKKLNESGKKAVLLKGSRGMRMEKILEILFKQ